MPIAMPRLSLRSLPAALIALASAGFVASAGTSLLAQSGTDSRTAWTGVYTDAQADRGSRAFDQSCANCHTLTATGGARALTGDTFWGAFAQRSVGDLLTYVRTSMPNGSAGSLPASTYNDIVAFLLKSNGFPAGAADLAPDAVGDVQIVKQNGSGELPANALARVVGCLSRSGSDWLVTNATAPVRAVKAGPGADDATRALGDRTITLKFVVSKLDGYIGQRVSVTGLLMGDGGRDGINVTTVDRVGTTCP